MTISFFNVMSMIVKRTLLAILWLILLIGSVAAVDLSPSTISSSNTGWLIANDNDYATITVDALDAGALPVGSANVVFSLDPASQDLGTINPVSPASVLTGADGKASAVFKTSTKSGTARIIATISVSDGVTTPVQVSLLQRIDHDTPETVVFTRPAQLPAGSVTSINVTLLDRWGNRIDNKNVAETIRLTMEDEGGAGLFTGSSYTPQQSYFTDAEGNVSATIRISTTVKSNSINMDRIGNIIVPPSTWIDGVAGSDPWYIAQTAASPASVLPADGDPAHNVEIYYIVTDQYDNPITGASVHFFSSDGKTLTAPTNTWGQLRISYPAHDIAGIYTLTAVPEGNTSAVCKGSGTIGFCSQTVEYYNTDPVDLTFTANPQTMTSLDVNTLSHSVLQARVIDIKGNPVRGEVVNFLLPSTTTFPGGPYDQTVAPQLSADQMPVGPDGYATVNFIPGKFAVAGPTFNATATGQMIVSANWTKPDGTLITKDVTLVWKNYPYISTLSEGDCGNSHVGDKVNITIQLYGDGAALQPKPIDVLLLLDNSGSMGTTTDPNSKLSQSKTAAINFVNGMTPGKDRVGVIFYDKKSFETPFSFYEPLTYDLTSVKNNLTAYSRTQTAGYHTRTRYALYEAITRMNSWNDRNSVRAIIHMTDGAWSMEGDPLARGVGYPMTFESSETDRAGLHSIWAGTVTGVNNKFRYFNDLAGGTAVIGSRSDVPNGQKCDNGRLPSDTLCNGWASDTYETSQQTATKSLTYYTNAESSNQNMSVYAASSKIRVYSIGYGSAITAGSDTAKVLEIISNATGAYYQAAPDATALNALYKKITGDLQETAGGNTEAVLDFGSVKINDDPALDIRDYMNYTFVPGESTFINKSNITPSGVYRQMISQTRDDTEAWKARTMSFDVGTIKLNETWRGTFTLNLTAPGKIDLFGPTGSSITFRDAASGATQTGFIPARQCRVGVGVNPNLGTYTLMVDNLSFVAGSDPVPNTNNWIVKWNTSYNGAEQVTDAVLYRVHGDTQWTTLPGGLVLINNPVFEQTDYKSLTTSDTTLWPAGKCFDIQIVGGAPDANAARSNVLDNVLCKSPSDETIYIKLQ